MTAMLSDRTVAAPRPVAGSSATRRASQVWDLRAEVSSVIKHVRGKCPDVTNTKRWKGWEWESSWSAMTVPACCQCFSSSPSLHLLAAPVVCAGQSCPERYERVNTVAAWCHSPAKWNRGKTHTHTHNHARSWTVQPSWEHLHIQSSNKFILQIVNTSKHMAS